MGVGVFTGIVKGECHKLSTNFDKSFLKPLLGSTTVLVTIPLLDLSLFEGGTEMSPVPKRSPSVDGGGYCMMVMGALPRGSVAPCYDTIVLKGFEGYRCVFSALVSRTLEIRGFAEGS